MPTILARASSGFGSCSASRLFTSSRKPGSTVAKNVQKIADKQMEKTDYALMARVWWHEDDSLSIDPFGMSRIIECR